MRACGVAGGGQGQKDKENADPSPWHRSPGPSSPAEQQQQNHSPSLVDLTRGELSLFRTPLQELSLRRRSSPLAGSRSMPPATESKS